MAEETAKQGTPAAPRSRRLLVKVLVALGLAYLATGVYSVRTDERAIVLRCGKAQRLLRKPGLHVGLPWGLDRISRFKPLQTKRAAVGTSLTERTLGRRAEPLEAECLTGDRNLVSVPAIVQYRISDPNAFLFSAVDVPALVRSAVAEALSCAIAGMHVDDVLTSQRLALQNEAMAHTNRLLGERYGCGVVVTALSVEGAAPPAEVADAFRDVARAREDAEHARNQAKGYRNRLLPEALGDAERITAEAEGYRQKVVEMAHGDAKRFTQVAATVADHPELARKRLTLETMEVILPRMRKVLLDSAANRDVDLGVTLGAGE